MNDYLIDLDFYYVKILKLIYLSFYFEFQKMKPNDHIRHGFTLVLVKLKFLDQPFVKYKHQALLY